VQDIQNVDNTPNCRGWDFK